MPQFNEVHWQEYAIDIGVGDNWRKILRVLTVWPLFKKDPLPYLNQIALIFNCNVTPPQSLKNREQLIYEWRMRGLADNKIYSLKTDSLEVIPSQTKKTKLVSDVIQHTIQYVGEIRFGRSKSALEKEQWQNFISLTVQDRDVYSMNHIMPRLIGILGFVLGVVITIVIQKILGVL